MGRFVFTSRLEEHHRDDLESLLYFNPGQNRFVREVEQAIAVWGTPEIQVTAGFLRLSLVSVPGAQSLYALDPSGEIPRLAGLVLFTRPDQEKLVLLHLAVAGDYSASGVHAGDKLVLDMLCRVREIARKIRGVRYIVLQYRGGMAVPVHANRKRLLQEGGIV